MTAARGAGTARWQRFVALGDSFTEGVGDPLPNGEMRGWADLVAGALAAAEPDLRYANLAIRGRRFNRVLAEQVPAALSMEPDLVSFAAGGNDALRPGFDVAAMMSRFDDMVAGFRSRGVDVVLFRFADLSLRLPLKRVLRQRIDVMNEGVVATADRHRAVVVDMYADEYIKRPEAWSADRLHLSPAGHRRVADLVLQALGVPGEPTPVDNGPVTSPGWLRARGADMKWAYAHLAPWVHRRLTGRSSGDARTPKRPTLAPVLVEPPA